MFTFIFYKFLDFFSRNNDFLAILSFICYDFLCNSILFNYYYEVIDLLLEQLNPYDFILLSLGTLLHTSYFEESFSLAKLLIL